MATYDPAAVRAALKTLLQTATTIQVVYDYLKTNVEGYPAIIFDLAGEDGAMLDEINNVRTLTFNIWIIAELPVDGQSDAKTVLDNATKEVINLLEKQDNATLSGTVDWTMPAVGSRGETTSPEGSIIHQEIRLRCNVSSTLL